jgi:hypothetical protein
MGILAILGLVVLLPSGPMPDESGGKAPQLEGHWQKVELEATVDLSVRGRHMDLTCEGKGIRLRLSGEYTVADGDAHLLYGVFTRLQYKSPDRQVSMEQP